MSTPTMISHSSSRVLTKRYHHLSSKLCHTNRINTKATILSTLSRIPNTHLLSTSPNTQPKIISLKMSNHPEPSCQPSLLLSPNHTFSSNSLHLAKINFLAIAITTRVTTRTASKLVHRCKHIHSVKRRAGGLANRFLTL